MKRDMDYVREILLDIESKDKPRLRDLLPSGATDTEHAKLVEHLTMLVDEAGFVTGTSSTILSGRKDWLNLRITWQGHDFLDSVRDPEIWRKAKNTAAGGGGFTLAY